MVLGVKVARQFGGFMGKSLVDNYSKEELEDFVAKSNSYRDVMSLIGYKSLNGRSYETVKKRIEKYGISTEHFGTKKAIKRTPENIFVENSTARQTTLRRWYIRGQYTEYKCAICGLPPMWQGKELVLTLDHINGNSTDDRLENLRWICPNCDRQLPTYSRGQKV